MTELLCKSSCSTTCVDAPLTSAANAGDVRTSGNPMTSHLPSAGPIFFAYSSIDVTAMWSRPATAQASVSTKKSLVRFMTASGRVSYFRDRAHSTRALVRVFWDVIFFCLFCLFFFCLYFLPSFGFFPRVRYMAWWGWIWKGVYKVTE